MSREIYSIDLGVDWTLPMGDNGNQPLQVGLCTGTIENNIFKPQSLASWHGFEVGDQVIVRVFGIAVGTSIGWTGKIAPELVFRGTGLGIGLQVPPWTPRAEPFREQEGNVSLCFTDPKSPRSPGSWPCHVQLTDAGELVPHTINPVNSRQWFLTTILLSIELEDGSQQRHVEDPEMVVSPDSDGTEVSAAR